MIQYKSINHQDTSLAEREEYFKNLEHKDDDSAVLLQTCNRVELYYGNGDVPDEVARHLFRVACGLESAIIGEQAVQGQIKEAFRGRTVYGKTKERKIAPLPSWYPKFEKHIERVTPLSELGELFNGNNLDNVQLSLYVNGNLAQQEFGDVEFTDGGLEGPLGFMVSRKAVKALIDGQKVYVSLDLKPAVELEKLDADIHAKWEEVIHDDRSKGQSFQRLFRIMLGKLIPWNLTLAFLKCNPKVSVDTLASALKDWRMDIAGFVGFERAVITAGGISTADVTAKTLESKKQPGLYFAGEVLDMDCDTGGYNMQVAFCTGYLAGQSAAKAL